MKKATVVAGINALNIDGAPIIPHPLVEIVFQFLFARIVIIGNRIAENFDLHRDACRIFLVCCGRRTWRCHNNRANKSDSHYKKKQSKNKQHRPTSHSVYLLFPNFKILPIS